MVPALLLRRIRGALGALPVGLLALAVAAGCETDTVPASAGQVTPPVNTVPGEWLPADLDGLWRGWSFPTGYQGLPVYLTLGFESLGSAPEDLSLSHYSFPSTGGYGTVNYLSYLTGYTLRFDRDGTLRLDTTMLYVDGLGNLIEERIWKELHMAPDGQTLAGDENILLTTLGGGVQTQQFLSFWLTLERLE